MKEIRCVFMFAVLTLWMALPVGAQNAKRGITTLYWRCISVAFSDL